MGAKEFYAMNGVCYDDVLKRLLNDRLVLKYLNMFYKDTSFQSLTDAIKNRDGELAFRSAHTLKGMCLNLEFSSIVPSIERLTESLRGLQVTEEAKNNYEEFSQLYYQLMEQIFNVIGE